MSNHKNSYKLPEMIIKKSKANTWDKAKQEWKLDRIVQSYSVKYCLCGHPIKEICILKNIKSGKKVIVGNSCVKKFMKMNSYKLFQSIKKVKGDIQKNFNADFIQFAYNKGIIPKKDYDFYMNIWRKKKLSQKQMLWKTDINKRILNSKYFKHDQKYT